MAYADLVEQQTSTTGTGTYTISGSAPAGRRTWLAAFPSNAQGVPYVVTDDAGNFECGIGSWNTAGTLARTIVLASSNADAAVDWGAGSKRVYCGAHAGVMGLAGVRHNLSAGAAPTGSDGFNQGYRQGSMWIHGSSIYVCTGNGSWAPVVAADAKGNIVDLGALRQGFADNDDDVPFSFVVGDGGTYVKCGAGTVNAVAFSGVALFATSADATPVDLEAVDSASNWGIGFTNEGHGVLEAIVVAVQEGAGSVVSKSWKVTCAFEYNGTTVTLGTPTITVLHANASASAWDVDVVVVGDIVGLQGTGAAATDIAWSASVSGVQAEKQSF